MNARLCPGLTGVLAAVSLLAGAATGGAQVDAVYSRGTPELIHRLERLGTTASVMHIGAHPDDEDSALIARLARGDHARVAYLSLNRGEGGQNVIGSELFTALGVIRTEELLQARRLDGGDQFFTRAVDYGFGKTTEEAAAKWGEEEILADVVRALRRYRPLVVISRFTGTPADGHGQHRFSGHLVPRAVEAAGDPERFPEQLAEGLRPWRPLRLYVSEGFRRSEDGEGFLALPTGELSPTLGRTHFEIAMEGRSLHRSQQMGALELRGPQTSRLRRYGQEGAPAESHPFDGIDTSLTGIPALAGLPPGSLADELEAARASARVALEALDPRAPQGIVPLLAEGLRSVRSAREALPRTEAREDALREADFLLGLKEEEFIDALVMARGIVVDALAARETVVAGSTVDVSVKVFHPEGDPVETVSTALDTPAGWTVEAGKAPPAPRGFMRFPEEGRSEAHYRVGIPAAAPPTGPYYLESETVGSRYTWPEVDYRGDPFAPPLLQARVRLRTAGVEVEVSAPVEHRRADRVRGEIRSAFVVVPAVTADIEPSLALAPLPVAPGRGIVAAVRVTSHTPGSFEGEASLSLPPGWTAEPDRVGVRFEQEGESRTLSFEISPPADLAEGSHAVGVVVRAGGGAHRLHMQVVDYPHIQVHRLYTPARMTVTALPLEVAPVRVGYIMGTGDAVPQAIRRMGLEVSLLEASDLATGDLGRYDTIVVGIRASQVRPDFVANHGRLLDFVRAGGTLITQYQQPDFVRRGLPPYPVEMSRPPFFSNYRVTDETAPITVLEPEHPAFLRPNVLRDQDWDGWVQERSLYHFSSFSEDYTPLLEAADPGEEPLRGSQVVARLGQGHYVYTAVAWFRQLPAGVPGAYRLFANLLALGHTGE